MSYGPPGAFEPQYTPDGAPIPLEHMHFNGKGEAIHPDFVYTNAKGEGIPADLVNRNAVGDPVALEFAHSNSTGDPIMVTRLQQPVDRIAEAARFHAARSARQVSEPAPFTRQTSQGESFSRLEGVSSRTRDIHSDYARPVRPEHARDHPWVAYAAGALLAVAAFVGYNKLSDSSADDTRSTPVEQPGLTQPEVQPQVPDLNRESLETQAPAVIEHLNHWLETGNPQALSAFNMERTEEQLQELADAGIQRLVPGHGAEAPVWRNQRTTANGNPLISYAHLVEGGTYYADRGNGVLESVTVYVEIEEVNGVKEVVWVGADPPA
jgi:hypothetical protein